MLIIVILVVPFLTGCVSFFLKSEAIHECMESFHIWLIKNEETFFPRKSKLTPITRYTLEPLYSLLVAISDWTEDIDQKGLKSGIRIAAYLYFLGFIIFIFVTLGPFILFLALLTAGIVSVLFALRYIKARKINKPSKKSADQPKKEALTFVETVWPHFRVKTTVHKVEELFGVDQIEVTYHGDVFANDVTQDSGKIKIGIVDLCGGIYDTREEVPLKIGSVDTLGNVIDERNWRMDDIIF
jgi:hypothetical protein